MRTFRDERGLVLSWLVKILIGLALGAIVLFDAGSIVVNHVGLQQAAEEAASVLASSEFSVGPTFNMTEFQAQAEQLAEASDARLVRAVIDDDGDVRITLKRTADPTIIVGRIDALKDLARATAKAQAPTQ